MTSSMTSQGDLEFGPLHSFINEITTFFMITKKWARISSFNFLCISIMRLWLHLYNYIFMKVIDDVTRSQSRWNFEIIFIFLRQYLSVDQKLEMSQMLMAIFLVHSTSDITSGEKVCRELKMTTILKILIYLTQLQFDLTYENVVPNYDNKCFFMVMTSSMTSKGGLKVSIYIHV